MTSYDIDEYERRLDYFRHSCTSESWFIMPEFGYLAANALKLMVVLISKFQCLTFVPFDVGPKPSMEDNRIIYILNSSNIHWVSLKCTRFCPYHQLPLTGNQGPVKMPFSGLLCLSPAFKCFRIYVPKTLRREMNRAWYRRMRMRTWRRLKFSGESVRIVYNVL